MKKYLVTGGAGFIGANFVKYLVRKYGSDVKVLVFDSLTYAGNLVTIAEELKLPNVVFVKGDIRDAAAVRDALCDFDPDYVVNFAAESHVDRSIENPQLFLETNILGTQNMLERVREAWYDGNDAEGRPVYREGKKFLQISTDEVYGSLHRTEGPAKPLVLDERVARVAEGRKNLQCFGDGFFTEETPLSPRSPYSAAKTSADLFVQAYHETFGLPVSITRCSNNYGPYQYPEKLIPLIIKNILAGKRLPVYGKGENVRDWLYVDDHCKGIDMVLRNGRLGEVYNIGGFNEKDNISIVRLVIALMRRLVEENPRYRAMSALPPEKITEELIEYVTDRPGHDMRYAIDPEKIAVELGWYPETSFEVGIEKTVRWYLENTDWVKAIGAEDAENDFKKKR